MATENADLSASLEDYLEAIFNLSKESNIARSKDIAKSLGVSRASVTGALRVLKEKGLANYKPYDYVTLTETGQATAAEIAKKHKIIASFFIDVLGIESNIAQVAACKAEHALAVERIPPGLYSEALESWNGGKDLDSAPIFVCEICGNTVIGEAPDKCPVCNAPKARFSEVA